MKHFSAAKLATTLLLSLLLWATLASLCLLVGSTGGFGWPSGGEFSIDHWSGPIPHIHIAIRAALQYRLDMVLLASLVGAALAAAGVVYQAILRNPLADPYLLGVSSGAMLSSYLWQLPWATVWIHTNTWALGQQSAAFIGALLTIAIVFALSTRRGRLEPITLLLVGVIVNAVNGAIFLLINSIQKDTATPGGPFAFIVGSIQTNLTESQKLSALICIALGWTVLLYLAGQLNVATLTESEALSLGVRIHHLRWIALLIASLITASAVAISGPIGFIGLVCPHLIRLIVGNDQRKLLPLSTALGAALLAIADAASRKLSSQSSIDTLLPVGVLTGLLGGPFFLLILYRSRHRQEI